jgi:hypothetical protein
LTYMNLDPRIEPLHADPRYEPLLRRMGLATQPIRPLCVAPPVSTGTKLKYLEVHMLMRQVRRVVSAWLVLLGTTFAGQGAPAPALGKADIEHFLETAKVATPKPKLPWHDATSSSRASTRW